MNRNRKPALSIDNSMSAALTAEVKDGKYNLDDGVPLGLSKGDKSKIIYRKYEAVSDNITDTRHREWHEVLVAHEKISLLGMEDRLLDDDIVGISADDGMIEEEAMGIEYVRYTEWGFRLVEVLLTNGPEARQRLAETYERQKNMEQAEMFTSMEEFFSSMMGRLEQMGQVTNNPQQLAQSANSVLDPHKVMQEMLKTQSPEQLKAMIEMQGAEEDIVPEASAEELADDAAIENALEGVGSDLLESATTGKKSGRSKK